MLGPPCPPPSCLLPWAAASEGRWLHARAGARMLPRMTANITITLSDEVLGILQSEKSIAIALGSTGPSRGAGRTRAASPAGRAASAGGYRPGSLPERLIKWAGGRKRPFGVQEVMTALEVKRAHASMVLTRVMASGDLKRVGRGAYAAA